MARARPVERHDEPIPGRVDLPPSEAVELLAHGPVVIVEERTPVVIAEGSRALGGSDDVGEQHSREDAIDLDRQPLARQEVGGLVGDDVEVGDEAEAAARDLDKGRAGNVLGEVATVCDRQEQTLDDVQHAGRSLDERQRLPHVHGFKDVAVLRGERSRSRGIARPESNLLQGADVIRLVGIDRTGQVNGAPAGSQDLDDRVQLLVCRADGVVVVAAVARRRVQQDEPRSPSRGAARRTGARPARRRWKR